MTLNIQLFGLPRMTQNGERLNLSRRKTIALLAYLAGTRQPQSRETLMALLWPDADDSAARMNLRRDLSRLRKQLLDGVLVADRLQVELNLTTAVSLDIHEFEATQTAVQNHAHANDIICAQCAQLLQTAVTLADGEFMAGFSLTDCPQFDEWLFFQREQYRQSMADSLRRLIRWCEAEGAFSEGIGYGRALIALDPFHEASHRVLMRLYALADQPAAAVRQYEECVRVLDEELGVPPEAETVALFEAIRTRQFGSERRSRGAEEQGSVASLTGAGVQTRDHLPTAATAFVGREQELAQFREMLADSQRRLITVVGVGGMGKTRLALAVARQHLLDASPQHGVYFVPLAPLSEPTQIVSAVADALNFSLVADGQQGSHKQLFDYLSQKEMLIVLDNFEHLLAGTSLVSELLQTAPKVQIVATSRERLQLQEEQVYPIQGLSFPETALGDSSLNVKALQEYTAVQLFIQTVLRIQPNFNPQPEELPTLIQICRLLNGMPLAVELAAGWADMLPIADILAEIQRSLDFLETEVRNVPERHRSMRAVFDASWQRLSVDEQAVFAQLTIFQGGFTREVGQAVTSASLRLLGRLVNKSLLYYDAHQKRYQIHELLRQYGAERLEGDGERATAVARQHGLYYLTLLHQHTPHLKSQRQQMALAEIEVELGNIRMAWHWAIEQKAFDYLSQAMDALRLFYEWKGLYQASGEAAAEVEMAIANLGTAVEQLLLVKTLTWQALVCRTKGENKQGQLLLERSNSLRNELAAQGHDTRREQIENLLLDGQWALDMDFKLAPKIYEQACNIAETLADEWYQAQSLRFWGMAEYTMGQYETAEKRLHKALTLARQTGDMRLQARILDEISQLAAQLAQFEKAEQYVRQSHTIYQSFADPLSLALGTGKLGIILIYAGKVGESVTLLQQSFTLFQDIGNESMLAQAYIRLGMAQTYGGKPTVARANMEEGLALYRQLSNVGMAGWALWGLGETLLAVADYEEAQQVFGESTLLLQQAGHLDKASWSLGLLGLTASFLGNEDEAKGFLKQGLKAGGETHEYLALLAAVGGTALLYAQTGKLQRAAELYGLISRYPFFAMPNEGWPARLNETIRPLLAQLSSEDLQTTEENGRELDLWKTAVSLLDELTELDKDDKS